MIVNFINNFNKLGIQNVGTNIFIGQFIELDKLGVIR